MITGDTIMALVRYNPWHEMNSIQKQLNHLFDDVLTSDNWGDFSNSSKIPAAELTETDDALHLKLEIPGISTKDLDIQVMIDRVAIVGERKAQINERTRSEFRYGKFSRVIPLPARIQNTNVTADYQDGILNLTLPKAEEEKNKVVKVSLPEVEATE